MHGPAVTGQQPLEAIGGEVAEGYGELRPRIPTRVLERDEVPFASAPRKGITGKEHVIIEQVDDAAAGVPWHRDRE